VMRHDPDVDLETHRSPPVLVRRTELRYALVVALCDARCPLTVQELHDVLVRQGCDVDGRPGKVISDALRTEVVRGRVRRLGRSLYQAGAVSRQTRWRMRTRIARRLAESATPAAARVDRQSA
jgi:hypothetical protein